MAFVPVTPYPARAFRVRRHNPRQCPWQRDLPVGGNSQGRKRCRIMLLAEDDAGKDDPVREKSSYSSNVMGTSHSLQDEEKDVLETKLLSIQDSASLELTKTVVEDGHLDNVPGGAVSKTVAESESVKETEKELRNDGFRISMVVAASGICAGLLQHSWVAEHRDLTMWSIFILGYAGIILEELLDFSKTSVALVMGVGIWITLMTTSNGATGEVNAELSHKLSEISEILFFLIGAMTIVEIVDSHGGFKIVTDAIRTNSRRVLLWAIGFVTFFMSSVLDNLTSTIIMISLLRKLISDPKERWLYGSVVVVAANAGGAWTPIGDVTTTMLWIHGNITAVKTICNLFLPSVISMVVSLALFTTMVEGDFDRPPATSKGLAPRGRLVFLTGLASLLSVPLFKAVTGLPPYLGMLSGLGVLWLACDVIHAGEDREELRGEAALKRIDTSGVMFFLGVLLTVGGLESAGLLQKLAYALDAIIPGRELIAAAIGMLSAIVDNVPLVAATMGMYDLGSVPQDSPLWQLIAFCAGTGGSMLIIGSAAGVALMSLESVPFGWFAKKITLPTFAGFAVGIVTYMLSNSLHISQLLSMSGN